MATPITQTKTDEERDRLIDQCVDAEMTQVIGGQLDETLAGDAGRIDFPQQQQKQSLPHFPIETEMIMADHSILNESNKNIPTLSGGGGGAGGATTPQSPIVSLNYSGFIKSILKKKKLKPEGNRNFELNKFELNNKQFQKLFFYH